MRFCINLQICIHACVNSFTRTQTPHGRALTHTHTRAHTHTHTHIRMTNIHIRTNLLTQRTLLRQGGQHTHGASKDRHNGDWRARQSSTRS